MGYVDVVEKWFLRFFLGGKIFNFQGREKHLGGGNSNIFGIFTPGEDNIPIWRSAYVSDGVGEKFTAPRKVDQKLEKPEEEVEVEDP